MQLAPGSGLAIEVLAGRWWQRQIVRPGQVVGVEHDAFARRQGLGRADDVHGHGDRRAAPTARLGQKSQDLARVEEWGGELHPPAYATAGRTPKWCTFLQASAAV